MRYALLTFFLAALAGFCLLYPKNAKLFAANTPSTFQPRAEDPNMKKATFAAGCFWGVEETFRHISGVVSTQVGYTGGKTDKPDYHQVCTDTTGHAEAVEVTFDPGKISYAELLDAFWTCHNPTTANRQGPDLGSQYRSVIFTHGAEQEKIAKASFKEVADSGILKKKIVTEIVSAGTFFSAEDYHQQYFAKNGGVCHAGIAKVTTKLAQEAKKVRETTPAATQP